MFRDAIDGYKNTRAVVYTEDSVLGESFVHHSVYDFGTGSDRLRRRYESETCGNRFKRHGYWCF